MRPVPLLFRSGLDDLLRISSHGQLPICIVPIPLRLVDFGLICYDSGNGLIMRDSLIRFLRKLFRLPGDIPPGSKRDPYAWKPAPLRPRPGTRSGSVTVAEPDENRK